ncbi:hypothetical protein LT85_4256 [Collimonas arenae]|uniref:Uncharacterized protein n=1 Tax=Collimonas arenae TaxID=279058 RepID=A0A0A1FIE8_9BURK|nr:hypothetical protein LT85_4256 [Collimonas arenae]
MLSPVMVRWFSGSCCNRYSAVGDNHLVIVIIIMKRNIYEL